MSPIGDENRIHARLLSPFVQEEHITDGSRPDRHHTPESKATQGSRTHQSIEVGRECRADATENCQKDGKKRDWPSPIDVCQRGPEEWRYPAQDYGRRGSVSSSGGVDVDRFAQHYERGVDECRVVRTEKGHEADLDEDRPFQPSRPILPAISRPWREREEEEGNAHQRVVLETTWLGNEGESIGIEYNPDRRGGRGPLLAEQLLLLVMTDGSLCKERLPGSTLEDHRAQSSSMADTFHPLLTVERGRWQHFVGGSSYRLVMCRWCRSESCETWRGD